MHIIRHLALLSFLLLAPLVAGHTQIVGARGISTGVSFEYNENDSGSSRVVFLLMHRPSLYTSAKLLRFTPARIMVPQRQALVEVSGFATQLTTIVWTMQSTLSTTSSSSLTRTLGLI